MINCEYLLGGIKILFWTVGYIYYIESSKWFLIDGNLKALLSLQLGNLPVLLDRTWSELRFTFNHRQSFPCWCTVLKVLLTTFTHSSLSTSHMLAKVVRKRKLICFSEKSLKVIYLLIANVTCRPYLSIESECKAGWLTRWCPTSSPSKTRGLYTIAMRSLSLLMG